MQKFSIAIEYWANKPIFKDDHIEIERDSQAIFILRDIKKYLDVLTKVCYHLKHYSTDKQIENK